MGERAYGLVREGEGEGLLIRKHLSTKKVVVPRENVREDTALVLPGESIKGTRKGRVLSAKEGDVLYFLESGDVVVHSRPEAHFILKGGWEPWGGSGPSEAPVDRHGGPGFQG